MKPTNNLYEIRENKGNIIVNNNFKNVNKFSRISIKNHPAS